MMKNGSEALASQKEKMEGDNATLKCHLRRDDSIGGSEVQFPIGSEALASQKEIQEEAHVRLKSHPRRDDNIGGTEVPLPKKYTHLPHIDLEGYYQFVTFRTFDSVDEFVRKWDFSPAMSNKEKQQKIDEYLDISTKGTYLKDDVLKYLFDFLISNDKKLYELVAFAIMNNHVHILFKPLESLSKVMQIIKGASAKKINELIGKNGKFWADDYYDKVIRDENHFSVVYEYIKNNPLKIGEIYNSEAKASLPNGTYTPVSENNVGEIKYSLPRFYGVFE